MLSRPAINCSAEKLSDPQRSTSEKKNSDVEQFGQILGSNLNWEISMPFI